ncbi:MAG: rod shape determining protein RodA [Glaciecola sp.]|jgi:rod shape determining protein RodA
MVDAGYFGADRSQRELRASVQQRWQGAYAPVRHLDPILVMCALALAVIGLFMIRSATASSLTAQGLDPNLFVTKQIIALAIGIIAMVVSAVVDYRYFRAWSFIFYAGVVLLLVVVLTPLGVNINGAQRWIEFGGFQVQPSELAKVAIILVIAAVLNERKGEPTILTMLGAIALALVPVGLILLEPDLGSAIVFIWLTFVLFLVGGVKLRWLLALVAGGLAGIVAVFRVGAIKQYQLDRITAFLDSNNAALANDIRYQLDQSLIAVGSGQLTGKGYRVGSQNTLSYVPENHTDFIFTIIGEEFGFLGAVVVLALFAILMWRGLRIAMMSKDLFGTLICAGTVGLLALQVLVNVGMTIGIMPVTGMPLPFISYGSNALISFFLLIGVMLNVHMRRFN